MADQVMEDSITMKRVGMVVLCLVGVTAALIIAVSVIT